MWRRPPRNTPIYLKLGFSTRRTSSLLLSIEQRFDMQILGDDLELDALRCLEQITSLIVRSKTPKGT